MSGHGAARRDRLHGCPEGRLGVPGRGRAGELLSAISRSIRQVDSYQQRHSWLGFPIAVAKKYGEDKAGQFAALLAYYGFFSVLPLLLVLVTVLGIVLQGNPKLQASILDTALAQFPVIGDQLKHNITAIKGSLLPLAVGLVGALWGGLGVMQGTQAAMNEVWRVPGVAQPNYFLSRLRSLLMLAILGGMLLASVFLSTIVSFVHGYAVVFRLLSVAGSYALSAGVFLLAYRVLTSRRLSWRDVLPGAATAAAAWVGLQAVGGYILNNQVRHATALYGFFGFTVGLLLWIYFGAEIALYGAEINSVLRERRWPRPLQDKSGSETP